MHAPLVDFWFLVIQVIYFLKETLHIKYDFLFIKQHLSKYAGC